MTKEEAIKNYIAELDRQHEDNMDKLKAENMQREYEARKKAYPNLSETQLRSPSFHADRLQNMLDIANNILVNGVPNE